MIVGHSPKTFRTQQGTQGTSSGLHGFSTRSGLRSKRKWALGRWTTVLQSFRRSLQFFLSRSSKDPLMTQNRNLTVIEKLKLCQMMGSVQPSSSCRPEVWNTSLRTVPRTLSARYVKGQNVSAACQKARGELHYLFEEVQRPRDN